MAENLIVEGIQRSGKPYRLAFHCQFNKDTFTRKPPKNVDFTAARVVMYLANMTSFDVQAKTGYNRLTI